MHLAQNATIPRPVIGMHREMVAMQKIPSLSAQPSWRTLLVLHVKLSKAHAPTLTRWQCYAEAAGDKDRSTRTGHQASKLGVRNMLHENESYEGFRPLDKKERNTEMGGEPEPATRQ